MNTKTYTVDFYSIIKEALPESIIRHSKNFDDFFSGWDISPIPGTLIRFMIELNDDKMIRIIKYRINPDMLGGSISYSDIYSGTIPASEDGGPDLVFIKQILRNWMCVG